jgi:hypothetical protein
MRLIFHSTLHRLSSSTYTIDLIARGIRSWWPSGAERLILWRQRVLGTAGEELHANSLEFDVFHTRAQFFGLRRNNDRRIGNRFYNWIDDATFISISD